MLTAVALLAVGVLRNRKKKRSYGWTLFVPLGINVKYLPVDLENGKVTGQVMNKEKTVMTVEADLKKGITSVTGNLPKHVLKKGITKEIFINQIETEGAFYLKHSIRDPEEYKKQIIKEADDRRL